MPTRNDVLKDFRQMARGRVSSVARQLAMSNPGVARIANGAGNIEEPTYQKILHFVYGELRQDNGASA